MLGLFSITHDTEWRVVYDSSGGVECNSNAPKTKILKLERKIGFEAVISRWDELQGEVPNNPEGDELSESMQKALKKFMKIVGKRKPILLDPSLYSALGHEGVEYKATYIATKYEEYKCSCSWFGLGSWEWRYKDTDKFFVKRTRGWKPSGRTSLNVNAVGTDNPDEIHDLALTSFIED